MKNRDIFAFYMGLQDMRAAGTTRFSARVSFAITRNLRLIEPIAEDIQLARTQLLNKYGEPMEEAGQFFISNENKDVFDKEANALDNTEVDIVLSKIKFSDIEHLELTVQEMDTLYYMLEEEGD